jgi:hypothetical protein
VNGRPAACGAVVALVLLVLGVLGTGSASADPVRRCTVEDPRLLELSGLAVAPSGDVWAMADSGRQVRLQRVDLGTCDIVETRTADIDPLDAEDLALGPDGTFWVADTGDNNRRRDTVALIAVPARGEPRLHRLTYPDGAHDAEAVLVGADGVPVIVTKEVLGSAGVYRPAGPLAEPGPTPLTRVGTVVLPRSDSSGGPIGDLGSYTVTGGATSADGSVVALRTYTDAWLYRMPQGSADVVAALDGVPTRVALPDEPQGEALAFLPDGTLLSGSETRGLSKGELRAVPGAAALALAAPAASDTESATPPVVVPPERTPEWQPAVVGGAVAVGLLVIGAVAMTLHGHRRR